MNILALTLTLLVGLCVLVGSIIGHQFHTRKNKILDLCINFVFASMITIIAIKLIPNILMYSVELLGKWRGFIICASLTFLGFVIIQQIDLFNPHHEDENKKHEHNCHFEQLKHIGIIIIISISLNNFIQGIDVFNRLNTNIVSGLLLSISYIIWNITIGIFLIYTLINKIDKKKIFTISTILSVIIFIGGILALLTHFNNELIIGLLLSVSLGMFIYIVFCELLDQVLKTENKKDLALAIVSGIIITIIGVLLS